jgi:hypothetical protein
VCFMSVSAIGFSANAVNVQAYAATSNKRAADGDYQTPGAGRSSVKDSDGDYKPLATAQSKSSSAVQAAVTNLKIGGK